MFHWWELVSLWRVIVEIINGNVTESGIKEAKRIWRGREVSCVPV